MAGRILVEEGEGALSVRRLASAYGASTMAVYSLFGSKDAVIDALLTEGFRRFARSLGGVEAETPGEHLRLLSRAYRDFALQNPTFYQLMWSRRCFDGSGGPGRDEARAQGMLAFACLTRAVSRVAAECGAPADVVEPSAMAVWSAVHGAVLLELAGAYGTDPVVAADHYERLVDVAYAGFHALYGQGSPDPRRGRGAPVTHRPPTR